MKKSRKIHGKQLLPWHVPHEDELPPMNFLWTPNIIEISAAVTYNET